ncbi:AbrB/MazE/SpoVT family DNA-binding domain-containing protein [Sphingomonas sp. PAMC 26605]|uniref:AbrB/MazE/SpoVT family DNA-binding domain-containing protein n=1 Tax=Sphingomonas sp. PAMC 26605 TaxID=1112214 RepID=UPI00026CCABB|nr:AbrB/MazE/SpoVT family DNA-binding domain-containing protein [Sphingomonas sp. PAMC 26605]
MTYHAKVIAGGKIVIPAELRREFGISDGDSLVLAKSGEGISLKTYGQVVREAQQAFREMTGDDYSVDQFLRERASDWREE